MLNLARTASGDASKIYSAQCYQLYHKDQYSLIEQSNTLIEQSSNLKRTIKLLFLGKDATLRTFISKTFGGMS